MSYYNRYRNKRRSDNGGGNLSNSNNNNGGMPSGLSASDAIFDLGKNKRVTVRPVSYTHLDVYKRQVLYGSAYAFVGHLLLSHVQFAGDCSCAGDVSGASGVSEALMHALMRLLPSSSRTTGSSLGVVKV